MSFLKEPVRALGLDGVFNWIKEVIAKEILSGRLIEDIEVSSAGEEIAHGLGRTPVGVVIVKAESANGVKAFNFTKDFVTLTSKSGTFNVSVWIF
jgi:hypothetical protein